MCCLEVSLSRCDGLKGSRRQSQQGKTSNQRCVRRYLHTMAEYVAGLPRRGCKAYKHSHMSNVVIK